MAEGGTGGAHFEQLTWSNVLLLHCIVRSYVFILYMMFYLEGDIWNI